MTTEGRVCGSCTMCCKLMGVEELKKPATQWCDFCSPGKGCNIYATRPPSCQNYKCMWLQGHMGPGMKPNKARAVFTISNTDYVVQVNIDPGFGWKGTKVEETIETYRNAGLHILVVQDKVRTLLTTDKRPIPRQFWEAINKQILN